MVTLGISGPTDSEAEQTSAFQDPLPYSEQVQPAGELPVQLLPQVLGLPVQLPAPGVYSGETPQSSQVDSATPVSVEPVSMPIWKVWFPMVTGAL
jgi:hypothetical protein